MNIKWYIISTIGIYESNNPLYWNNIITDAITKKDTTSSQIEKFRCLLDPSKTLFGIIHIPFNNAVNRSNSNNNSFIIMILFNHIVHIKSLKRYIKIPMIREEIIDKETDLINKFFI